MRRPPSVKQSIRVCRGVLSVDHREVIELRGPPCFYPHSIEASILDDASVLDGVRPVRRCYLSGGLFEASEPRLVRFRPRKSSQSPGLGGFT